MIVNQIVPLKKKAMVKCLPIDNDNVRQISSICDQEGNLFHNSCEKPRYIPRSKIKGLS